MFWRSTVERALASGWPPAGAVDTRRAPPTATLPPSRGWQRRAARHPAARARGGGRVPSCRQRRPPARPGAMPGACPRRHRHPRRQCRAPRAAGCPSASQPAAASPSVPPARTPARAWGSGRRRDRRRAVAARPCAGAQRLAAPPSPRSTRGAVRWGVAPPTPPPARGTGARAMSPAPAPSSTASAHWHWRKLGHELEVSSRHFSMEKRKGVRFIRRGWGGGTGGKLRLGRGGGG